MILQMSRLQRIVPTMESPTALHNHSCKKKSWFTITWIVFYIIYANRSFARELIKSMGELWWRFTVLVSLQGRRSWYLRLIEADRNSRLRREGFSLCRAFYSHATTPRGLATGLTMYTRARTRVLTAEPVIKRLRRRNIGEDGITTWCRWWCRCVATKAMRNRVALVRTSLTMACAHRKPHSPPRHGES